MKPARKLLVKEETLLTEDCRHRLDRILEHSPSLAKVYEHKQRLSAIWQERSATREALVVALQEWCREAEESGIRALQEFARTIPRYSLEPARI